MTAELLLQDKAYDFISENDKLFIIAFDKQLRDMGYDFGDNAADGVCWGKYMLIYTKTGVNIKRSLPVFTQGKTV